tara:strand:- start:169 stop:504 length:336 start_codon:yes stop_codon:yes gene_type:complete
MDTTDIKKQYFLERQWGMNCQPGHRKGKNKRRSAKKQHKRQTQRRFENCLEEFCKDVYEDEISILPSNDEKLLPFNDEKLLPSNDKKLVYDIKNKTSDYEYYDNIVQILST